MTERHGHPEEPVVIRDKRKVDRPRPHPDAEAPEAADSADAAPSTADTALLAERTADLQRLQAEYANYRKRAERDRLAAGDLAVGRVLGELLPVLDDIDRAREHGDLTGGLKAVADQLDLVFGKLGLQPFGEVGDPFDPAIHEAVMHQHAEEGEDITVATCTTVLRKGYLHGERLLRPAMVGVTDPPPQSATAPTQSDPSSDTTADEGGPDNRPQDPGPAL